jgi:hypothetical protein
MAYSCFDAFFMVAVLAAHHLLFLMHNLSLYLKRYQPPFKKGAVADLLDKLKEQKSPDSKTAKEANL